MRCVFGVTQQLHIQRLIYRRFGIVYSRIYECVGTTINVSKTYIRTYTHKRIWLLQMRWIQLNIYVHRFTHPRKFYHHEIYSMFHWKMFGLATYRWAASSIGYQCDRWSRFRWTPRPMQMPMSSSHVDCSHRCCCCLALLGAGGPDSRQCPGCIRSRTDWGQSSRWLFHTLNAHIKKCHYFKITAKNIRIDNSKYYWI